MMLASCEAETKISLPLRIKAMMALTKSLWPWKRVEGFREASDHDQIDLSQQLANSVPDLADTATEVRGATGPVKVAATLLVCKQTRQLVNTGTT